MSRFCQKHLIIEKLYRTPHQSATLTASPQGEAFLSCIHDARQIDLIFIVGIKSILCVVGMLGHQDLFHIEIHQQIADQTVGVHAGAVPTGLDIGIVNRGGKIGGFFA